MFALRFSSRWGVYCVLLRRLQFSGSVWGDVDSCGHGRLQKSRALIMTPNSRALITSTVTRRTPKFIETAVS